MIEPMPIPKIQLSLNPACPRFDFAVLKYYRHRIDLNRKLPGFLYSAPRAFTRLELLLLLTTVGLLAAIALPALAQTKPRSQRSACLNNLMQIGQAFRIWADDHGDIMPWNVHISNGGSMGGGLAWEYFSSVSNEFPTARVLVCPSDTGRTPTNFAVNLRRNNNLSYFIGTHASNTVPDTLISGDRDIEGGSLGVCGLANNISLTQFDFPVTSMKWSRTNHVNSGNVVMADGSAQLLSNTGLIRRIIGPIPEGPRPLNRHVLKPYLQGELSY
jgi:type II secretory pathway pseudopilin PulG